ncbi:hypothetical protein NQD34_013900 [Periophthalmus magnuspinnatus]|nr:hypothetical protein NQD34_013900 [Periophthalmus magnuspinnatus]
MTLTIGIPNMKLCSKSSLELHLELKLWSLSHFFLQSVGKTEAKVLEYSCVSKVHEVIVLTQLQCQSLGGSLAVIQNRETNDFLRSLSSRMDSWVGFSDAQLVSFSFTDIIMS